MVYPVDAKNFSTHPTLFDTGLGLFNIIKTEIKFDIYQYNNMLFSTYNVADIVSSKDRIISKTNTIISRDNKIISNANNGLILMPNSTIICSYKRTHSQVLLVALF